MKRRLFLKNSSVGLGGVVVIPTLAYGCGILNPVLSEQNIPKPSLTKTIALASTASLFQDGARLFDFSVSELRLTGSGQLASAETEDVTLSGVAGQVAHKRASVAAELHEVFVDSSNQLLDASSTLIESSENFFPLDQAEQAEVAQDFAFLKVLKASTILANAAEATPKPQRKVQAAGKMITSAELVHSVVGAESVDAELSNAELANATGQLNAYAEEYIGAAKTYSGEEAYVLGVHNYGASAAEFAQDTHGHGASLLMQSGNNIALSTGYFEEGVGNLNAEALFFNTPEAFSAEELVPFSAELLAESNIYVSLAEGVSAELGAAEMNFGAQEILSSASDDPSSIELSNIGAGGEKLDLGAGQFIAGTLSFISAEDYIGKAGQFLIEAESLNGSPYRKAENEIISVTQGLFPASENFLAGAEALQSIAETEGVENMVPSLTQILSGANHLQNIAESEMSIVGAAEMVSGSQLAEKGAIESLTNPAQYLEEGAEYIEQGTFSIMNGAAEFIEGYN